MLYEWEDFDPSRLYGEVSKGTQEVVEQLLLFSSIHVLPDVLQELYCLYMEERFVVMALFLKPHITIAEDFCLPYSGRMTR